MGFSFSIINLCSFGRTFYKRFGLVHGRFVLYCDSRQNSGGAKQRYGISLRSSYVTKVY